LLQAVWHHQRIHRDDLKTLDGRPVRILHPGFWNHEPGPDFRSALIQFGSGPPVSGDIEIDLHPQGWHAHAHDRNPNYFMVALHVVWDADTKTSTRLPTLALKDRLDAPLAELHAWLANGVSDRFEILTGQCCEPLRNLPAETWTEILRQAGQVRLQAKAEQFQARARQIGWDQTLWEAFFAALGYKNNVWPMRRLAELAALLDLQAIRSVPVLQARLLGLSGLLPNDMSRGSRFTREYVRGIWDVWWRDRQQFLEFVVPRQMWRLGGIRPANHPQRRLALAAHWLAAGDLIPKLERWFASTISDRDLIPSLLEILGGATDDYWSHHWTLGSKQMKASQPLIGPPRATDVAMNAILPWFWMRAVAGKSVQLQETAEHRYFAWPMSEDNAVLRLARRRLFGATTGRQIKTAAAQQAILQIVRDFCQHSNALCDNCPFPELVKRARQ
jgi:hypothetical protein